MTYEERSRARRKRQRAMARKKAAARRLRFTLLALAVLAFCLIGAKGVDGDPYKEIYQLETPQVNMECSWVAPPVVERFEPVEPQTVEYVPEVDEGSCGEDPLEAEKIEAALLEQGYFRDDVPLSYELQDYLHTACEETGVPYALALAVIQKETQFQNKVGDDGASEGYMQVQRRWHYNRMERLGVEDLMDPAGNFRVGCDFLAELLGEYESADLAVTVYNWGHNPGYITSYGLTVMSYYEDWKEVVGDG